MNTTQHLGMDRGIGAHYRQLGVGEKVLLDDWEKFVDSDYHRVTYNQVGHIVSEDDFPPRFWRRVHHDT